MQGFAHILLVGHSYGTYLVNRLASEQLDRVAGVVLIGAGYPVPGAGRLRWIFHLPLFVSASLATWLNSVVGSTKAMQGGANGKSIMLYIIPEFPETFLE